MAVIVVIYFLSFGQTINGGIAQLARACGSYPQCHRFESCYRYHEKSVLKIQYAFFNEINPFRICEMHYLREILLRNVKYACGV